MPFRLEFIEPWVLTSVMMLILALIFIYRTWYRESSIAEKLVRSFSATRRHKFLAALVICVDEAILVFLALFVLPIAGIYMPAFLIVLTLILLPLASIILFPIVVEVLEADDKALKGKE